MTRRPAGLQWRLHRRMQVSVRAWAPHGLSASQSASLCCCLLVPHFQAEGSAPSALPTPYMKMWGVCGGVGGMPRMRVMCGPRFICMEPENSTSCRWSWCSVDDFPPVTHFLIQVRMVQTDAPPLSDSWDGHISVCWVQILIACPSEAFGESPDFRVHFLSCKRVSAEMLW